jgi:hypothetical protein
MEASSVDADASVLPVVSSTICAKMCFALRLTTRRGRAGVPLIFLRTRRCRRTRPRVLAAVRERTRPLANSRDLV